MLLNVAMDDLILYLFYVILLTLCFIYYQVCKKKIDALIG